MDDGDIRDLGVGYYNFSADESTRQQQMGILNTLRERTKETRQMKQQKETSKDCFHKKSKNCRIKNIFVFNKFIETGHRLIKDVDFSRRNVPN